jgi:hypothetical protein
MSWHAVRAAWGGDVLDTFRFILGISWQVKWLVVAALSNAEIGSVGVGTDTSIAISRFQIWKKTTHLSTWTSPYYPARRQA